MRSSLEALQKLAGEDTKGVELLLEGLGRVETELMVVEDAREHLQRSLALKRKLQQGAQMRYVAQTLASLGLLELRALDETQARRLLDEAREAVRSHGAVATPNLVALDMNLAMLDARWKDALDAANSMAARIAKRDGANRSNVAVSLDILRAAARRGQGDAVQAARELQTLEAELSSLLPYRDARVARAKGYLAQALLDAGDGEQAVRQADDAARIAAEWLAFDHPLASQAKYIRAQALVKIGQRERGAALMREAQAAFQAKLGKPLDERLMRVLY